MIYLADLPHEHELRNTPLGSINAEYRWKQATPNTQWRKVNDQSEHLKRATFNQLGESWLFDDWIIRSEITKA